MTHSNWQINPTLQALGTGAAVLFSLYLPRGQKEIVLGKYLWSGNTVSSSQLSSIYGQEQACKYIKSPRFTWLQGHILDLTHRVLAVAFFYFTCPKLPDRLKTLQMAKTLFRYAEAPCIKTCLAVSYYAFFGAPIILKVAHGVLDYLSLELPLKRTALDPWKDASSRLGVKIESLLWTSLPLSALVNCATNNLNSAVQVYDNVTGLAAVPPGQRISGFIRQLPTALASSAIAYLSSIVSTLFYGIVGSLAFLNNWSRSSTPPSLAEVLSQFKNIDLCLPLSEKELSPKLDSFFESLRSLKSAGIINESESNRVLDSAEYFFYVFLMTNVYDPLMSNNFKVLEEHESDLRSIFGYQGRAERAYRDLTAWAIERYCFATMLLCANLHRLKAKEAALTLEQFKLIQYGLYTQAAYDLGAIKDPLSLIKNSTSYQSYCETPKNAGEEIKVYTKLQDRFKPLHQMFETLPDFQSKNMVLNLVELLKTLAGTIEASQERILTFIPITSNDNFDAFIASLYPGIPIALRHTQKRLSFNQIYEAVLAFKGEALSQ